MTPRIASDVLIGALRRRVGAAGGFVTILARGDATAGAILILTRDRDIVGGAFERGIGADGEIALVPAGPAGEAAIADYWQRRRRADPDLWVVEVDIADSERFAAETIASS